jgi:hypothetical protein
MVTIDQIVEVILRRATFSPRVVGAQLGNSVRQAFPSLNIKLEYGGLQSFIKQHCQGKLFWVGKNGPDDVYTTVQPATPETNLNTSEQISAPFWQAFANPERNFIPVINLASGSFASVPNGQTPPAGFVEVKKLTEDEHRTFAKEFLLFVDHQDRAILGPIVSKNNFWPEWSERITVQAFGRYRSKWLTYRFHRILNSLEARLSELGISEQMRLGILEKVKESKDPRRNAERAEAANRAVSSVAMSQISGNLSELRQLAHKAIDSMGEDELRRLWVPLGAVGDVLKPK